MAETFPRTVTAAELKVGDVVETYDGPWSTAIVKRIENEQVYFFRPYGTNADFTCTAGVICYTGVETFSAPAGEQTYKLWRHADNLK